VAKSVEQSPPADTADGKPDVVSGRGGKERDQRDEIDVEVSYPGVERACDEDRLARYRNAEVLDEDEGRECRVAIVVERRLKGIKDAREVLGRGLFNLPPAAASERGHDGEGEHALERELARPVSPRPVPRPTGYSKRGIDDPNPEERCQSSSTESWRHPLAGATRRNCRHWSERRLHRIPHQDARHAIRDTAMR
jgi:hypothetical protein